MVYDCFQFFNELDMLKIRLNVMAPLVDKFVISEATETFSGLKKPLYYEENKELFKEFQDKIIHVVVEDTPEGYTHDRDTFQKNAVGRGLEGCGDDDIIIFSDLDEIPNPDKVAEVIEKIKNNTDGAVDKVFHMAQRYFTCYLNNEEVSGKLLAYCGEFDGVEQKKWLGTKVCSYKVAKTMPLGELRWPKCKEFGERVDDGGWHFGYMGGNGEKDPAKRVKAKVKSAAHQELNNAEVLSSVSDRLKDGEDLFGRDSVYRVVPIDESFPKYIREHQDEYKHLIKSETTNSNSALHKLKKSVKRLFFGCIRVAKRSLGKIFGKS